MLVAAADELECVQLDLLKPRVAGIVASLISIKINSVVRSCSRSCCSLLRQEYSVCLSTCRIMHRVE